MVLDSKSHDDMKTIRHESAVALLCVAIVIGSGVAAGGAGQTTTEGPTATQESASLVFNDQTTDGRSVDIAEYDVGTDGETLAVWSLSNGDPDELLASVSPEQLTGFVSVTFDVFVPSDQTLVAAVHSGPPTVDNVLAFDTASVDVDTNPIVVGELPATDSNGDRLLEDIDGDSKTTVDDVLAYYRNRNSDAIRSNPQHFDFDGDGTAGTVFDAIKLYRTITG